MSLAKMIIFAVWGTLVVWYIVTVNDHQTFVAPAIIVTPENVK